MREENIIVVGSGFGGLAAAALLGKQGHRVQVLEKNEQAGGRASVWKKDGFVFDMGPSWYLMPDVFEKYFELFDKKPSDYMDLIRLDPSYRVYFDKADHTDIAADIKKNLALFDEMETDGAKKMEKYLASSKYQYDVAMKDFIYKDYQHFTDFLKPKLLVEGTKLHMFDKLDNYAKRYFESPKIRKILEYTIVFLGGSPFDSPALYSLMSHVDFDLGVWYPMGGLGELAGAIKKTAQEQDVEFIFNTPVTKINVKDKKVTGVSTDDGTYEADRVIVNADYAYADTTLLDKKYRSYSERYWAGRKLAPSAYLLYLGVDKKLDGLLHHTLYFHPKWEDHFKQIFKTPQWPDEPSYYACCPSKTDPSVAPKGKENLFILVPVAPGLEDTEKIREKYFKKILTHLENLIGDTIIDSITVKRSFAHNDFINRYNASQGTALGLAHTLKQTAIFRPQQISKKVKNLHFTGHYTHPGIGVPMVIISSQILAESIEKKTN